MAGVSWGANQIEYYGRERTPYNPRTSRVKIASKYVLREHVGPFLFASTALTSLMLLQYIAKRFGDLVGKGLPWTVIGKFFLLSIPFTVAMTIPMGVLIAVLYAFSRLAAENEITAFKASGVSMVTLLRPVFGAALVASSAMLFFNDQVLPRSNHELAVLLVDIGRTKPTFALKDQVINTLVEGKLYLRASKIDQATSRMRDVIIYDMGDQSRRRTIYADSGYLRFAPNQKDLLMTLHHGVMQEVPAQKPSQITRLFYGQDELLVKDVASGGIKLSNSDTATKSDREMGICEMQDQLALADYKERRAQADLVLGVAKLKGTQPSGLPDTTHRNPTGLGSIYCGTIGRLFSVTEAKAAEVMLPATQAPRSPGKGNAQPMPDQATPAAASPGQPVLQRPFPQAAQQPGVINQQLVVDDAKIRATEASKDRNRYDVEIQKKFSLAAACIIFVLIGAPIALRFPRGGVGLVIGVSFLIFAVYYVGLVGGEALSDKGLLSPFWAMWGDNILLFLIGLWLSARMGREASTSRGGDLGEVFARWRAKLGVGKREEAL
ncbi:MAG: permease YjgP/YjgQ family protein [Gemmatimonadetes bacterium]|nr:permease YjgP/YjgQ family protein [Gemmatimonadota bacterium]